MKKALVISVGLGLAAVMIALGLWQAAVFRSQGARSASEAAALPPVPLPSDATDLYGRVVTVTGHYLADQLIVGTSWPALLVNAFRTEDGQVVAVVRGQIQSPDEITAPPSGVVTQAGVWLPSQTDEVATPVPSTMPSGTIDRVLVERIAQAWPGPLANGYLVLAASAAAPQGITPAPAKLPEQPGRFRNEGYALQWWVFAAFTVVATVVVVRSMGRSRERSGSPR